MLPMETEDLRDERDLRSLVRESVAGGAPAISGRFPYARLIGGSMRDCLFAEAKLEGLNAAGVTLEGVRLVRSSFESVDLHDVTFLRCVFFDVRFESSQFRGVTFVDCTFQQCRFGEPAALDGPTALAFEGCVFSGMNESSGLSRTLRSADLSRCLFIDCGPLQADRLRESRSGALADKKAESAPERPRSTAPPPAASQPAAKPAAPAAETPQAPSRFTGLELA